MSEERFALARKKSVLIVDDESSYRTILREVLREAGMDVYTAENGYEALRKLAVAEIDIIISDIYMPMMDGVKFHRSVREMPRYEKLPFLFISGYGDEYALSSVKDPRIEGFLRKGSPAQELLHWLDYLTSTDDKRTLSIPGQPSRVH